MCREGLCIEVFPVKEGGIDRIAGRQIIYQQVQIQVVQLHSCDASHRSLYHFRIPAVCRLMGAEYVINPKPVGYPDDCSKVAGILHTVESKYELPLNMFMECSGVILGGLISFFRHFEDAQYRLWMLEKRNLPDILDILQNLFC